MPPLLKKKAETASAPSQMPSWHPSFRNYERLPDIKVVRTVFFVNAVAITVALAMFTVFIFKEYHLHSLRRQVADVRAQGDRDRRGSDQAIALFKKFQGEEKKILEIDAFLKSRPQLSDLLLQIGQSLPKTIALNSLDLRESNLVMRGSVRGASELASGDFSNYAEQLRGNKDLKVLFDTVTQGDVGRSPQTGRLGFELILKFKGAKK
jgi:hypothetical protein